MHEIWSSHFLWLSTSLIFVCFLFNFLLSSGARGDTRKAIERALRVTHDFYCVHLEMRKLKGRMAGSLEMASQIFYNPSISSHTRTVCLWRDAVILSALSALRISLQLGVWSISFLDMNLSESFTNQSIQFYEAEPVRLLETSENNTEMINSWVANKTNNKITVLVDSVSPSTQLMVLNAVSFNGK